MKLDVSAQVEVEDQFGFLYICIEGSAMRVSLG